MQGKSEFGVYLTTLIKQAGMTQTEFYTLWGIKKPYFYDIISGRVSPPPYPLQNKAMDILKPDSNTREQFYDLAAKGRNELPADIAEAVSENPIVIQNIRKNLSKLASTT